jgi:hypothetical protein
MSRTKTTAKRHRADGGAAAAAALAPTKKVAKRATKKRSGGGSGAGSSSGGGGGGAARAARGESFAAVAALAALDDTPAWMRHSCCDDVERLFGGGAPALDTEDLDEGVSDFKRRFPAVFARERFDEASLRQLFARLCAALRAALAQQRAHAHDRRWREAFRRMAYEIVAAARLVARRGRHAGLAPLEVPAAARAQAEAAPACDCGRVAVLKTSHTERNPGRLFYGCPGYGAPTACGFFAWKEAA